MLSITDNPEAPSRATEPALLLASRLKLRISHPIGRLQFYPLAKSMPEVTGFSRRSVRNGDYSSHRGSMSQQHPGKMEDDRFPSPDDKSFHESATPTQQGRKRWSSGSIPPRTAWKPQLHWLIADWSSWSQRHPERIGPHPRMINLPCICNSNTPEKKRWSPGSIPPRTV